MKRLVVKVKQWLENRKNRKIMERNLKESRKKLASLKSLGK